MSATLLPRTGRWRPAVLVAQPSLFDASRAPAGKHTLWAYCHVPNGSTVDMTDRIEKQITLKAPRARVWRALTNVEEFGTWFRVRLEGAFTPGVFAVVIAYINEEWEHGAGSATAYG